MTESDDALRAAREEIKRQAAEIDRLQHWQRAVDDACTVSWVPVTDDARETVKALISRECQIALDPLVSSDAQALIDRGREEANKGGGMLQKQKSSKLREITKADVSRAERWLSEAPRELKRNEYHKVKMLCKQVIRVLRRKETESACNNTETRSLNAEIEYLKARLEVSAGASSSLFFSPNSSSLTVTPKALAAFPIRLRFGAVPPSPSSFSHCCTACQLLRSHFAARSP